MTDPPQKQFYLELANELPNQAFTFVFSYGSGSGQDKENKLRPIPRVQKTIQPRYKAWFAFEEKKLGVTFGEFLCEFPDTYKPRQVLPTENGVTWTIVSGEDYLTRFDQPPTPAPNNQITIKNEAKDDYAVGLSIDGKPIQVTQKLVKPTKEVTFNALTYAISLVATPIETLTDGPTLVKKVIDDTLISYQDGFNLAVVSVKPAPPKDLCDNPQSSVRLELTNL
ncbi:10234_t:CDS:2 [Ambispora gerdemannii]|uniref:10234_t:CDS:1 n=1 Tax=Ambispora gerdemannii TaxID=144530 RepID=A0A9N8WJU9_9GLOM|nr:10234_t:CDS:2 [Ambispora gerdemannii]